MTTAGATSGPIPFAAAAAAAAAVDAGPLCGAGVRHVPITGSTNTDLVDEARGGDRRAAVLVADHQTAGRGRRDRRWDDTSGGTLLVSFRVPVADGGDDAVSAAHDAVAAVGAAARAACARFVAARVATKWPNDVVIPDGSSAGKLAGVLAEFVAGPDPVVVVGLGCNVESVVSQPGATSLREHGATDVDRDRLLAAVIEELAPLLDDPAAVHRGLVEHSATLGTVVRVELADGSDVEGTATGLRDDGRLEVTTRDGGRRLIATGDVVSSRPAD